MVKPGARSFAVAVLTAIFLAQNLYAGDFALQRAEFAKYHRQITGKDPSPDVVAFEINPKISASGKDAYHLVSKGAGICIKSIRVQPVHLLERELR